MYKVIPSNQARDTRGFMSPMSNGYAIVDEAGVRVTPLSYFNRADAVRVCTEYNDAGCVCLPIHCTAKSKQAWFSVVLYRDEPRDRREGGQVLAKFAAQGDAWLYAKDKAKVFPNSPIANYWGFVIR